MNPLAYWRAIPIRIKAAVLVYIHLICAIVIAIQYFDCQKRKHGTGMSWMNVTILSVLVLNIFVQRWLYGGIMKSDLDRCYGGFFWGIIGDVVWNYSIYDMSPSCPSSSTYSLTEGCTGFTITSIIFQCIRWCAVLAFIRSINTPIHMRRLEGDIPLVYVLPGVRTCGVNPNATCVVEIEQTNNANSLPPDNNNNELSNPNSNYDDLSPSPPAYKDIDLPPPYPGNPISIPTVTSAVADDQNHQGHNDDEATISERTS